MEPWTPPPHPKRALGNIAQTRPFCSVRCKWSTRDENSRSQDRRPVVAQMRTQRPPPEAEISSHLPRTASAPLHQILLCAPLHDVTRHVIIPEYTASRTPRFPHARSKLTREHAMTVACVCQRDVPEGLHHRVRGDVRLEPRRDCALGCPPQRH